MVDPIISGTLTASALVIVLIQIAKMLGLPDNAAPWASLVASIVAVALGALTTNVFTGETLVNGIIAVPFVFIMATGGYHVTKNIGVSTGLVKPKPEDPAPQLPAPPPQAPPQV